MTKTITLILLAALANWLPKMFPYFLVKWAKPPQKVLAFLSYLPSCIMFALLLSSVTQTSPGQLPQIKWVETLAILPTALVLYRSKNLIATVLVGVAAVALLRFWGLSI